MISTAMLGAALFVHLRSASDIEASVASLRRWAQGFAPFGRTICVRAAVAAARTSLELWERIEPNLVGPQARIAAVDAWLACPCESHAKVAEQLAWANGDDKQLTGFSVMIVEGKNIEDEHAWSAHWAADNAASAVWCFDPASACATGAAAAANAFAESSSPNRDTVSDGANRVRTAIVEAVMPLVAQRAEDEVERRFLMRLVDAPTDDANHAVYSDWLEEQRRDDEASFLRTWVARGRARAPRA